MLDITVYHGRELVSFLSSLEKQLIQRLPELTDRPASRAVVWKIHECFWIMFEWRDTMGRHKARSNQNYIYLGKGTHFVSYCKYHKKPMTQNQIRSKHCREKSCIYIRSYIDPFEAAIKRAAKLERKEKLEQR